MDEEIKKLTDQQYKRAIKILKDNKDKLLLLADQLLEKEVIFKEDLEKIFGQSAAEKAADKNKKKAEKKPKKRKAKEESEVEAK
ncbi:MAG: peptidase M41, partial [Bacteroidetes bacterium]|nr:peptidase M41 [Bacteroidota bacterium]